MPRLLSISLLVCFATTLSAQERDQTKTLLLLGQSPDGHEKTTHEYLPGVRVIAKLLEKTPGWKTRVVNADEPWTDGPELIRRADGAVLFLSQGAKWFNSDPRRLQAFVQLASRGGGLSVLHWGMGTREANNIEPFVRLLGGCHGGPDRKFKIVQAEAQVTEHAIATGIKNFRVREEFYYRLKFADRYFKFVKPGDVQPVLRLPIDGNLETVAWAWPRTDGGRSFGFSGLHFHDNWKLPEYRRLVKQGILWTMKVPIPKGGAYVEIDESVLKLK